MSHRPRTCRLTEASTDFVQVKAEFPWYVTKYITQTTYLMPELNTDSVSPVVDWNPSGTSQNTSQSPRGIS